MLKKIKIYGIIALIAALPISFMYFKYWKTDIIQTQVTDKERVNSQTKEGIDSQYRVYTTDGAFTFNDSWLAFNFDTADDYGALVNGNCYEMKVRGTRIAFISWFQNIDYANEIPCEGVKK